MRGGTVNYLIRTHKLLSVVLAVLAVFAIVSYIGNRLWF